MREKRHGVWVTYTWRDVVERVERAARGLAALGLQRGDVLAILSENIVESFWTEYAALALGARVVFAYPDLTAQELLYILDHSEEPAGRRSGAGRQISRDQRRPAAHRARHLCRSARIVELLQSAAAQLRRNGGRRRKDGS
jgi:acyl-coenzyme A synthetase/AMP-(fatty) acid ligase